MFLNAILRQNPSFSVSCASSAGKAGEAAAEEREDTLQGPLGVEQGERRATVPTGPQRQQWS